MHATLRSAGRAVLGGALVLGALGLLPTAAQAQSYGGGPGITINVGGGGGTTISVSGGGGGGSSFVPTTNVNPVSASVSPVYVAPRAAPPAPPPAPVVVQPPPVIVSAPPPVEEVAGRVAPPPAPVEREVPAVVAPPPAPEAPPSIVRPPVVEEVAGRPPVAPGPGLTIARVLPRAGEGPLATLWWPPALLVLAGAALALLAAVWPRRPHAERHG